MNEKLNLVKVLKDCPKGMELDCTMYENVTFVEVCKDTNTLYPIYCITTDENGNRSGCSFTKNGYASPRNSAKCVIFPKGKTTWEGFQRPFKDGDILYIDCNDGDYTYKELQYTFILKEKNDGNIFCYCYIDEANINKKFEICWLTNNKINSPRFATEEEKQRLFKALKDNGYKWNADEKKMEKLIVPKFKVGDKIKEKNEIFPSTRIIMGYNDSIHDWVRIEEQDACELVPTHKFNIGDRIKHKNFRGERTITSYEKHGYWTSINDCIDYKDEDDWELLVITPKFKVGDRIRKKGDYICGIIKCIDIDNFYKVEYSGGAVSFINVKYQNEYELVPNKFNPKSLQPFDKVLVSCNDEWFCDFFSHYDDTVNKFNCTCTGGCPYEYCIPYNEDTKYLIGKSIKDTPKFYRYWEEQI